MKKNKQDEEQQAGRRFREAVDGPEIEKRYATTPTKKTGTADGAEGTSSSRVSVKLTEEIADYVQNVCCIGQILLILSSKK